MDVMVVAYTIVVKPAAGAVTRSSAVWFDTNEEEEEDVGHVVVDVELPDHETEEEEEEEEEALPVWASTATAVKTVSPKASKASRETIFILF